jgi:hypothetical protein
MVALLEAVLAVAGVFGVSSLMREPARRLRSAMLREQCGTYRNRLTVGIIIVARLGASINAGNAKYEAGVV